jgi:hypothetical protein
LFRRILDSHADLRLTRRHRQPVARSEGIAHRRSRRRCAALSAQRANRARTDPLTRRGTDRLAAARRAMGASAACLGPVLHRQDSPALRRAASRSDLRLGAAGARDPGMVFKRSASRLSGLRPH